MYTLRALVESPFGKALTFKGGTSLSKAYHAIRRFSEDLDITYDIQSIAPDLVAGHGEDALPPTHSQAKRWTQEIRKRLAEWAKSDALTTIKTNLSESGLSAQLHADGYRIFVNYKPLFPNHGLVKPRVMVEFGARSTGEPREKHLIVCDAASHLPGVAFPSTRTFVMLAERTFWEKATAMHVFCRQQRSQWERLSRHWYDLVRLDEAGFAERSLADRALARSVARHKSMFYRENDAAGSRIDYEAAVSGDLQLVPHSPAYEALADDYDRMRSDGMLPDDEEQFEALMERCADIQERANRSNDIESGPTQ